MLTFTIARDNSSQVNTALTVNLSVGGTATFGVDYTVSGAATFTGTDASVVIPAGALSAAIVVIPVPDLILEPNETVILSIVPTAGVSQVGVNASAVATILNDDVGDPLFNNVVLLLPFTTAAGITDIKGKVVTNQGSTASTTINDPFGNNVGVRAFAGSAARISVAQSNDFAFGNGAFAIDGWLYPTAFPAGNTWGLMDTRLTDNLTNWVLNGSSTGQIAFVDFSYPPPYYEFGPSGLVLNQWQYFCISRTAVVTQNHKVWVNGSLIMTAATRNNMISAAGLLIIGDQVDAAPPFNGSFTGYMSNIRITRAYRDGSIVPNAPFFTT